MTEQELIAHGFVPTKYEGQEGIFLVKKGKVRDFPYSAEHLVDEDYIFGDSEAILDVTPDGQIQFYIPDSDYLEGPYPLDSELGRGLLNEGLNPAIAV